MSELDDFLRWVAQRRDMDWGGFGYGTVSAAIDMFRAERETGRRFTRWVDASEALHPRPREEARVSATEEKP